MSTTIDPVSSCFLIVEPKKYCCDILEPLHRNNIAEKFFLLEKAANLAKVPRWFAVFNQESNLTDNWLSKPCSKTRNRVFNCDEAIMPWRNAELVQAIRDEGRGRLVICGFWLDAGLGASALEALTDGFDVHVITDLTFAKGRPNEDASFRRLDQFGVVPVTLGEVIFELMCWIEDRDTVNNMKNLLENPIFSLSNAS